MDREKQVLLRHRYVPILCISAFILLCTPAAAVACRCKKPEMSRGEEYDAVFMGTAVRGGGMQPTVFQVDEYWKLPEKRAEVTVSGVLGTCTKYFTVGESYVVYAKKDQEGLLRTHICQPGARGNAIKNYTDFLGPGEVASP